MIDPHPVPSSVFFSNKQGAGVGVHNSSFFIIMGMKQMMTSDDNGGRSVKKELIYN
jgi:hypothetical protein